VQVVGLENQEESDSYNASGECSQRYHELSAYFMMNPDRPFLTQHVVDAYGAQHSNCISLISLYLAVERGNSVQQAHMETGEKEYSLTVV
jgi:hypothetical protein